MPLHQIIQINPNTTAYFWKITEEITQLYQQVQLNENSINRLQTMLSTEHQKGFLAVRMLLQHLGLSDFDLQYDEFGKPFLKQGVGSRKLEVGSREFEVGSWESEAGKMEEEKGKKLPQVFSLASSASTNIPHPTPHISISHAHDFSCICISNNPIGIDIEKIKPKTLKIAPRFMAVSHLENLTEEEKIAKATVIWGVKESVFKLINKKGISFPNHISESEFNLNDNKGKAQLNFDNSTHDFQFHFYFVENYAFVCVLQKNINIQKIEINDHEILTDITKTSKAYWGYSEE